GHGQDVPDVLAGGDLGGRLALYWGGPPGEPGRGREAELAVVNYLHQFGYAACPYRLGQFDESAADAHLGAGQGGGLALGAVRRSGTGPLALPGVGRKLPNQPGRGQGPLAAGLGGRAVALDVGGRVHAPTFLWFLGDLVAARRTGIRHDEP